MGVEEDTMDYLIHAEHAATGLRKAGEAITDNIVLAIILKGLPEFCKPFVVVDTQLDRYKTLSAFKAALNNYSNTEAIRSNQEQSSAMASKTRKPTRVQSYNQEGTVQCLLCGKMGHKSQDCRSTSKLQCQFCQQQVHVESIFQ